MKPILMKLSGINSFTDEQQIDFERLCGHGIFGIFGPTGSGKSTVLDAMTLALYNDTARGGGGFVNELAKKAYVYFRFGITIGGNTSEYIIERLYKANANGSAESVKARLTTADGNVIADKTTTVNNAIKEIIGLNYKDFSRSVVLPQGKFGEFLMLKGAERSAMLERIFALERYGTALAAKLKKRREALSLRLNNIQGQLAVYGQVSPDTQKTAEAELAESNAELERTEASLAKNLALLKEAEEIWSILSERISIEKRLASLSTEEEKQRLAGERLTAAERAERCMPYLSALNSTREKLTAAEKEHSEASAKAASLSETLEPEEARARAVQEEYNARYPLLIKQEEGLRQAARLQKEAEKAEAARQELIKEYKALTTEHTSLNQKIELGHSRTAELTERISSGIKALENDEANARKAASELKEQFSEAGERLREASENRLQWERSNMAAALSALLEDGQPCAVCGSTVHPDAARAVKNIGKELINMETLLKKGLNEAENKLKSAETHLKEVSSELVNALSSANPLKKELEKTARELETAKSEAAVLSSRIEVILARGKEKRAFIEEKLKAAAEATGGKNADACIAETSSQAKALVKMLEASRLALERLKNDISAAENASASSKKALESLTNIALQQKAALDKSLAENGFETEEAASAAYIDRQAADALRTSHSAYISELNRLNTQLEHTASRLGGRSISPEELEQLRQNSSGLSEKRDELKSFAAVKTRELQRLKSDIESSLRLKAEEAGINSALSSVAELARATEGKKFVEYMAASRLEYIAEEASRRLLHISRGRYCLRLNGGEFAVSDAFNGGVIRSASTLSGGEVFLASFSLALALSSKIQMKNSAPLEFFFLDEGFGSLDADLADLVMASLERLGDERLSVGIITHVDALKDRIPVSLNITPGGPGYGAEASID